MKGAACNGFLHSVINKIKLLQTHVLNSLPFVLRAIFIFRKNPNTKAAPYIGAAFVFILKPFKSNPTVDKTYYYTKSFYYSNYLREFKMSQTSFCVRPTESIFTGMPFAVNAPPVTASVCSETKNSMSEFAKLEFDFVTFTFKIL